MRNRLLRWSVLHSCMIGHPKGTFGMLLSWTHSVLLPHRTFLWALWCRASKVDEGEKTLQCQSRRCWIYCCCEHTSTWHCCLVMHWGQCQCSVRTVPVVRSTWKGMGLGVSEKVISEPCSPTNCVWPCGMSCHCICVYWPFSISLGFVCRIALPAMNCL